MAAVQDVGPFPDPTHSVTAEAVVLVSLREPPPARVGVDALASVTPAEYDTHPPVDPSKLPLSAAKRLALVFGGTGTVVVVAAADDRPGAATTAKAVDSARTANPATNAKMPRKRARLEERINGVIDSGIGMGNHGIEPSVQGGARSVANGYGVSIQNEAGGRHNGDGAESPDAAPPRPVGTLAHRRSMPTDRNVMASLKGLEGGVGPSEADFDAGGAPRSAAWVALRTFSARSFMFALVLGVLAAAGGAAVAMRCPA